LAAEVTLQPIRRYDFDAAILFSDILVVPDALGQKVEFQEGEGPRLEPIAAAEGLKTLNLGRASEKFARVCETVERLRQSLPHDIALIGFCGAPWTVASYMVAGRGTPDQAPARLWAYRDPRGFGALMELLVDASVEYLCAQVAAGADILQVFDTWAGSLPDDQFARWVEEPTRVIVERVRARYPHVPIIGFPRGGAFRCASYVARTGVQALGCDTSMPISQMSELSRSANVVVQGNIDPLALVSGGEQLAERTRELLHGLRDAPHIFNLGHGIVPQTPPEHVADLVRLVRSGASG
jgi:uroporphyrinogen decarboxylase